MSLEIQGKNPTLGQNDDSLTQEKSGTSPLRTTLAKKLAVGAAGVAALVAGAEKANADLVKDTYDSSSWVSDPGASNSMQNPIGAGPSIDDDGALFTFNVAPNQVGQSFESAVMHLQLLAGDTPEGWVFQTGIYNNFDFQNFQDRYSMEGFTLDDPATAPDDYFHTSNYTYQFLGESGGISNWEVGFSLLDTGWESQLGMTGLSIVPFDPNDGDRIAGFGLGIGSQALIDQSIDGMGPEFLNKFGYTDVAVDINLTSVPEPGSAALFLSGGAIALLGRRRRS